MKLFKKGLQPPKGREIVGHEACHRLVKEWDADAADYRYFLSEGEMLIWDDGTRELKTMYGDWDGLRHIDGWHDYASGDKKWAKKTANHYGIEVPK